MRPVLHILWPLIHFVKLDGIQVFQKKWTTTPKTAGRTQKYTSVLRNFGQSFLAKYSSDFFNVIQMQAMRPKDFSKLGSPTAHKAPNIRQICAEIYQDGRIRGFYAGIGANLIKAICASIQFGIWEYLKTKNHYKSK